MRRLTWILRANTSDEMIPRPPPDEQDLFLFYGQRFTRDCLKFYILWFVLGFFVDVPHLGLWWVLAIIFGSPLLGFYLVSAPYNFLVMGVLGGAIWWVLEHVLRLEGDLLARVRGALHTFFYMVAVVYQFLLVRFSLDFVYGWVN